MAGQRQSDDGRKRKALESSRQDQRREGKHVPAIMYKTSPAIVTTPPATGVKEQGVALYAEVLSQRGYITLACDPKGRGESEGIPFLLNPWKMAEVIRNGVSYLLTFGARQFMRKSVKYMIALNEWNLFHSCHLSNKRFTFRMPSRE